MQQSLLEWNNTCVFVSFILSTFRFFFLLLVNVANDSSEVYKDYLKFEWNITMAMFSMKFMFNHNHNEMVENWVGNSFSVIDCITIWILSRSIGIFVDWAMKTFLFSDDSIELSPQILLHKIAVDGSTAIGLIWIPALWFRYSDPFNYNSLEICHTKDNTTKQGPLNRRLSFIQLWKIQTNKKFRIWSIHYCVRPTPDMFWHFVLCYRHS